MIRPYMQGDKHFKVKRTKDGRFEVYDDSKKFGEKNYVVAIFDAEESQDALEAADNLNKQNDELNMDNRKFFTNLRKELRGESLMQYMDDLIVEQLKRIV